MNSTIIEYKNCYGDKGILTFVLAYKCRIMEPSFDAMVLIRKMQNSKSYLIKIRIRNILIKKYGIEISPEAKIGDKFKIEHLPGIVIGAGVIIGNNVTVYHNVTLGKKQGNYPIVMDNTTIYSGAKILGGIRIGENAIIGANSVVLKDIPDNAIVAGVPAKVIKIKECN